MGILIYLITLRIKRIFDFKNHPIKTISILLAFGVSIFYGYIFASLYNSPDFQEKLLSQNEFKHYLILSLVIITFLRGFFPSYIPLKNIIADNYPLNKREKFSYNIINEFIYPFYFGIVLFVSMFSVEINNGGSGFLINAISWVAISHFLKRLVQFLIEFRLPGFTISFVLLPIIVFYYLGGDNTPGYLNYIINILTLSVLIVTNYFWEYKSKEPKIITKTNSKNRRGFYFTKLLLNNKLLRSISLISILYKVFFLFMIWNMFKKNGSAFSKNEFFFYIFFSPIVLFSYFFNNFFGFSRTFWLSMNKAGATLLTYSKEMFKVLSLPLIIDVVLTVTILLSVDKLNYSYISLYISSVIVLFAIGVTNSFYLPKQVESVFTMRGNTSIIGNIFSMLVFAVLIVLTKYIPFLNLLFSVLVTFGLYFLIKNKIKNTQYKIFQKIFD